ncbi:thyroid transcription factor 1-associated protein 26 [Bombina bombina]|uniref:thyroid transcription factor 1-associated protein 26 n=1 Tax=Bombina bombina TaxID=8345 RepID=UPI00235A6C81|nr:thyroid transcription factor 1-associated protein 26 [Bombina bombina]
MESSLMRGKKDGNRGGSRGRGVSGSRGKGAMRGRGFGRQMGRGQDSHGHRKANHRWRPDQHKVFEGSAKEGQGFALWRKQKIQFEYKKLQRKQRKGNVSKEHMFTDNYPEHLKHLYLAEEEMIKKQEKRKRPEEDKVEEKEEKTQEIPLKKFKKKTANQKAKDDYEKVQQERAKKREEAERNRKQREEALQLYKKKKMETFKILNTKTKKGQPNFNVQMEYLLQKIQKP